MANSSDPVEKVPSLDKILGAKTPPEVDDELLDELDEELLELLLELEEELLDDELLEPPPPQPNNRVRQAPIRAMGNFSRVREIFLDVD